MSEPRFSDYRDIQAKFDSTGTCGHPIKKGDSIGWCRRRRVSLTQCSDCWTRWTAENREADMIEAGYMPCPW